MYLYLCVCVCMFGFMLPFKFRAKDFYLIFNIIPASLLPLLQIPVINDINIVTHLLYTCSRKTLILSLKLYLLIVMS